jgi:hypothetical protein
MSLIHYIAANKELPVGEFIENRNYINKEECENIYGYDQQAGSIFVENINHENESIQKKFIGRYIYMVFANIGKFYIDEQLKNKDLQRYRINRKCIIEFFNYIYKNIEFDEEIEVYTCWYGEESKEKNSNLDKIISLNNFKLEDNFEFKERQYIIIRR